jgi:ubiquitin C-terminal hydrolase
MNPLFAGIQANDSKDLVLFMLETMHNELNEPKKNVQNNAGEIPNQYDFKTTFNIFRLYFTKNFNSIISNIFYGMYNSMMTCLNCKVTTHNVQCYNIFIFPLEEVRIFKNKAQNMVSIIECFEYYQKTQHLKGENQIYCNQCKTMADFYNTTKIIICPNVLVINLNRGKGAVYECNVNFPENLNLLNYVSFKQGKTYFQLYAVICHLGPSSMSGHFVAYCRHRQNNKWYKYNDSFVTECTEPLEYTKGMPYILFYKAL